MGMKRAVIVGINEYTGSPLRFCVDDAKAVADLLAEPQYGFSVDLILDSDATKKNIKRHLENAFSGSAEFILFYFAGHGIATDLGGFLDTVDSDAPDDGLSLEILRRLAERRLQQGSSLLYILDCCHSGLASARHVSAGTAPLRGSDIAQDFGALGGTGRIVIAACQEHELAYEAPQFGHGIFTFYLLEGLMSCAADSQGDITAIGLYDYISLKFYDNKRQMPFFRGDLTGRLILGTGFAPIARSTNNEIALAKLETEAERHLADYHAQLVALKSDPAYWRAQGFKQAATNLDSVLRWLKNTRVRNPGIDTRSRFKQVLDDAKSRQGEFAQISAGTVTAEGEAIKSLGHGNFGSVWQVRLSHSVDHFYAFKVFHPQDLFNDEKASRFERGFHAMEKLDHPFIVKVRRLTNCPFGYYMDFVDGPNFRSFYGTLDNPAEILAVLITIAETLQHAHGRGVIHRDLKPENILFSYEPLKGWMAHLTDFDLAWFSTASQLTKTAFGAMYYASPEQLNKPGSASARAATTDIYSFGKLMYFAFCGNDPSIGSNLPALQARVRDGWSEHAARRLIDLFVRCVQDEPKHRPSDFRHIVTELGAIRSLLLGHDLAASITPESFVRELAFSVSGLDTAVDSQNFSSLSGKIRIGVEIVAQQGNKKSDVTYSVHCLEPPTVPGMNHQRMRETLLARIERAISGLPGASKRPGNQLPFHVYVDQKVHLDFEGVQRAATLIGKIIDAIEFR